MAIVDEARELTKDCISWVDVSNKIYGHGGLLSRHFPAEKERRKFVKTPEYAQIKELIEKAIKKFGWIEGAVAYEPLPGVINESGVRAGRSNHQE